MLVAAVFSIYIASASAIGGFDPKTGEIIEGANCEQYHRQIDDDLEMMEGEQYRQDVEITTPKGEKKMAGSQTQKIRDLQIEAMEQGCPPDPRWGKVAGKRTQSMPTDSQTHAYVPATEGESALGWNMDMGDFGYSFSFSLNSIFPDLSGIFGQVDGLINKGKGYINQGQGYINQGQGYINQGQGYINQGQGYVNQGQSYVNQGKGKANQNAGGQKGSGGKNGGGGKKSGN